MAKPELEFCDPRFFKWRKQEGKADGLWECILAEDPETGAVTRLLRIEPGADSAPNGVQVHDFWEELYIIEGDITDHRLNKTFTKGMVAVRPPGMEHGPWKSQFGCLIFEVRYYTNK